MSATPEAFATALESERDTLQAFLRLLHTEQQALVRADTQALAALSPDKARLIERLTQFDRERLRDLEARALAADHDGVATWLQGHATAAITLERLSRLWQELLGKARAVRSVMDQNQLLIADRLAHSRSALAALRAAAAVDQVYVADGQLCQVLPTTYLPAPY